MRKTALLATTVLATALATASPSNAQGFSFGFVQQTDTGLFGLSFTFVEQPRRALPPVREVIEVHVQQPQRKCNDRVILDANVGVSRYGKPTIACFD